MFGICGPPHLSMRIPTHVDMYCFKCARVATFSISCNSWSRFVTCCNILLTCSNEHSLGGIAALLWKPRVSRPRFGSQWVEFSRGSRGLKGCTIMPAPQSSSCSRRSLPGKTTQHGSGGACDHNPVQNNLCSLIRNLPNKKPPLGWGLFVYYQFRRRHDFPPHKIPPLGGKYCYYQFRRRRYQFRRRQRSHVIMGGIKLLWLLLLSSLSSLSVLSLYIALSSLSLLLSLLSYLFLVLCIYIYIYIYINAYPTRCRERPDSLSAGRRVFNNN